MRIHRNWSLSKHWLVIGILLVSLMLRWILIFKGGQYYFPDEIKYDYSNNIVTSLLHGNFPKAFADLVVTPGQVAFRAIAILPALVENYFHLTPVVPALFFSVFSVANLYLVWKIAKRVGLPEQGAYFALLIAAASHSLMYFSRHLLPYDLSLFFGLMALYIGLDPNPDNKTFIASGSSIFLCFASYSGYWTLAGLAAFFPVVIKTDNNMTFLRKALFTLIGIAVPFFSLAILILIGTNQNLFADYKSFAETILQGNFAEGWSLPFEYLWHSEHFFSIIVVTLSMYATLNYSHENQKVFIIGVGGMAFIYLCLFIPSTILHKFVVYGRLSRQLTPFLILASAQGLFILINKGMFAKAIAMTLVVIMIVQGGFNYYASSNIIFPREFIKKAQAEYSTFKMSVKRTNTGAPFICTYRNYMAVNVKYIYPSPEPLPDLGNTILLSVSHPINFFPYQYEGYSPEERKIFRDKNIKMELLRVENSSDVFTKFGNLKGCVATSP